MRLEVSIKKAFPGFNLEVDFDSDVKNIALLGHSGSGKSITLKCIAGIIKPDEGFIRVNGVTVFDSERHINLAPQKRGIGYLFQSYALFPNMTVRKNILTGLHSIKNKDEKEKKYQYLIQLLKIEDIQKNYPHEISGGQAQRVALARILASNPKILLLDEPFSALDAYLRNKLQMDMKELLANFDGQSVLVTHDRDEAYLLAEETVLLDDGQVVIQKNTKELFVDPIYYKAAIMSGCKNFSKAVKIGPNKVFAIDWGINIPFANKISDDIKYVGVRAHYFSSEPKSNKYEIEVIDISEETFNNLVRFRFKNQNRSSELVMWKVEKNIPLSMDISEIYFDSDDVLLLK